MCIQGKVSHAQRHHMVQVALLQGLVKTM